MSLPTQTLLLLSDAMTYTAQLFLSYSCCTEPGLGFLVGLQRGCNSHLLLLMLPNGVSSSASTRGGTEHPSTYSQH